MAESAVSFLLDQLSELLRDERHLLGGLKTEVESIQGEMEQMRAFLRVADAKEESDPNLKVWIRQLREISYDVQDVLDKYMLRLHGHHNDTDGFKGFVIESYSSIKDLKAKHQIASEIQAIRGRLEDTSKSYERYKGMYDGKVQGSTSTQNEWWDGRDNVLFLEDADVVGIEKPKKQLVEWIMSMDNGIDVISVVGMGGLGKTTLVKKAYDDDSVKRHFNRHVWIVASDYADAKHLLANLIKKLVGETKETPPQDLEDMSGDDMREFIYKFLEQKNYIIVVDDVWDICRWEAIRFSFPKQGSHGCIIITTRFNSIGKAACSDTHHFYELQPLPLEKSEELFHKKAFPRNACPPYLKEYAESMLKRCDGLPLAIVVIGGLLATKNNRAEEWELFSRSFGDELEEGGNLGKLSKILSLSYYDLPYHLKYCYLYLSIFPEGGLLKKWKMVRLWVAEGFVQVKQGMTPEEVAEVYIIELISRSLIQVASKKPDGRAKTFRVHDLLHEYITLKSREHNIVSVYCGGDMDWPNKVRRLAIQKPLILNREKYSSSIFKYIRTLILVGIEYEDVGQINELIGKCRLLKVLHLEGARLETIPDEVFKLYHLKHLSLRDTMVKFIPRSIKNLRNLETLDLKNTNVTELPVEILKLHRLRHLLVYKYKVSFDGPLLEIQSAKAPCNLGDDLPSLQKLCYVDVDEVNGVTMMREIGKLTQLRRLGISKLRKADGMELCSSISKLTKLHSLSIVANEEVLDLDFHSLKNLAFLRTLELRGHLEKAPQCVSSLVGLTSLSLLDCRTTENPLNCLQDLPNLASLVIHDAFVEGLNFKALGFKKLKELELVELKYLKFVIIEKGSMPLLEEFRMWGCKLVTNLPQGIEHLSNLQSAEFCYMGDEFVDRLGGDDDWHLALAHVPCVRCYHVVNGTLQFYDIPPN